MVAEMQKGVGMKVNLYAKLQGRVVRNLCGAHLTHLSNFFVAIEKIQTLSIINSIDFCMAQMKFSKGKRWHGAIERIARILKNKVYSR